MKHPAPSSSSWGLPLRGMGWGMGWNVTDGEMILPSMAVEVRGPVKLLPALLAFEHGDLVEEGVTIEMVSSVEPLPADLTEKYFVLRVGVGEDVLLEEMLTSESLPADLARYGRVFPVPLPV